MILEVFSNLQFYDSTWPFSTWEESIPTASGNSLSRLSGEHSLVQGDEVGKCHGYRAGGGVWA